MMAGFQTRLAAAAARRGLSFSWQPLKYGYQRAVFPCDSFEAFVRVRSLMERMKDASVETWKCDIGNVFEGYVYVMDAAERRTLQAISMPRQPNGTNGGSGIMPQMTKPAA